MSGEARSRGGATRGRICAHAPLGTYRFARVRVWRLQQRPAAPSPPDAAACTLRTAAGHGPRSTDDPQFKPSGALPPAHFLPRARLGGAVALLDRSAGRGDHDDLGAGARRVCAGERRHVIPRLGSTQRQPPTRACRSGPPLLPPSGAGGHGAPMRSPFAPRGSAFTGEARGRGRRPTLLIPGHSSSPTRARCALGSP